MKYLITILGYARTGTNYLSGFLGSTFSNINSNYELFNRKECYMNKKYLSMLNQYDLTENPILFLEKLIDISEEPIISHKIFPEHLALNDVFQIIDTSDYLIIMKRNFIDVYISKKRAMTMMNEHSNSNPWINIDTTHYKIEFNKDEFENQKKIYDDWYGTLLNYIIKKNKKYYFIDYDSFHSLNLLDKQCLIKEELGKAIPLELLTINPDIETLNKQDKSSDYKTKIINYEEFINYIDLKPRRHSLLIY